MSDSRNKRTRRLIVVAVSVAGLAAGAADLLSGRIGWLSAVAVIALVLVLNALLRVREQSRSIASRQPHDWWQTQHLAGIYASLNVRLPLPAMREWAASPDLLTELITAAMTRRPGVVVEASCGVSTIVLGYCLQRLAEDGHTGHVYSLEQTREYADACRNHVNAHGLQAFVTVLHAPLQDHNGMQWYDTAGLPADEPIDLLVIDGPSPGRDAGERVREPALPILDDRLSAKALVLLDDGARDTERETVERWTREFPHWTARYVPLEKGAWALERN